MSDVMLQKPRQYKFLQSILKNGTASGTINEAQTYLISFAKPHGASNYMKRAYIAKAIEIIDEINS